MDLFKNFIHYKKSELQKNLFKKRCVLLKSHEKSNLDSNMLATLRRRSEKDISKASQLLDEKIQIQLNLLQMVLKKMIKNIFFLNIFVDIRSNSIYKD